tara:strand:+ start:85 stop:2883 length:2799 start_codon:yes stop_codon:yes gene_type:complete
MYFSASQMSNLTIVLGYTALLVIMGALISLKATNPKHFMLGNRSMPGWLLASSIIGTSISSLTFLTVPSKGFELDLNYLLTWAPTDFLGGILTAVLFISFLRRTKNASIYTLLGDYYGSWAAFYASAAFILFSVLRMGIIMCLVAKAIHIISGSNVGGIILLCGIVVIFYTYMAGIEGVIWTDFIQTIFLSVAGIACLIFVSKLLPEGINQAIQIASTSGPLNKEGILQGISTPSFWATAVFFLLLNIDFYATNQGVAQRYLAARSDKAAKRSIYMVACINPFIVLLFFLIGLALYGFYQLNPSLLTPECIQDTDKLLTHFISTTIPDGLKGFMIIGILSAAMSTVDTGINSGATVFISNIYEPYIKRNLGSDAPAMQVLRQSSLFFGAIGLGLAYLIFNSNEGILDTFVKWYPVTNGGIFGLFVLMRLAPRIEKSAGISALVLGSLVIMWITFTSEKDLWYAAPVPTMASFPLGVATIVISGLLLGALSKRNASPNAEMSEIQKMDQPTQKGPLDTPKHIRFEQKSMKQSMLQDALRPNPYYRAVGLMSFVFYIATWFNLLPSNWAKTDNIFLSIAIAGSLLLTLTPAPKQDIQNKTHSIWVLTLLGITLPFMGAMSIFAHPDQEIFGYFFLITITLLGSIIDWAMLGFIVSISTCIATQVAAHTYPEVGIPENWLTITIASLGIMTLYAMSAARRKIQERQNLESMYTLSQMMLQKTMTTLHGLTNVIENISLKDESKLIDDLTQIHKTSKQLNQCYCDTVHLLRSGIDDLNQLPTQSLSVRDCLQEAIQAYPFKNNEFTTLELDTLEDFEIEGNRNLLVHTFTHLLNNAFYYVSEGTATYVICRIDQDGKVIFENDGPGIDPRDIPYLFDLFFSRGKLGTGLGLTFCRKALKVMNASIHYTSKPGGKNTQFTITFEKISPPVLSAPIRL